LFIHEVATCTSYISADRIVLYTVKKKTKQDKEGRPEHLTEGAGIEAALPGLPVAVARGLAGSGGEPSRLR
jgi:hypothetical protein